MLTLYTVKSVEDLNDKGLLLDHLLVNHIVVLGNKGSCSLINLCVISSDLTDTSKKTGLEAGKKIHSLFFVAVKF